MAAFAPHPEMLRFLEAMTGRSDGQRIFDALVRRGLLRPWSGIAGFWWIETLDEETWGLLSQQISREAR